MDTKNKVTKKKLQNPIVQKFPGYPQYPEDEDIFVKAKELTSINPEDLTKIKSPNELPDTKNEKDFKDIVTGDDLDIPGAQLDDQQEIIGSEDEENNYYSIGGDLHDDLEENKD
ncbi:MAG TPA: hypothetical protein PLY70_07760 [Saprospiraceae bacterium]|nr:hypothetical protein [Saprospiraceae bacterium]